MNRVTEWYAMERKGDSAEILIYEQIGEGFFTEGLTAKQFVQDLAGLGEVKTLNIRINSPGGSVFDGNAIYNALRSHGAKVHVFIDGLAASIASVIAMAGDTITMPENAMLMIHDPWSVVVGSADDMRKQADAMDKMKLGLVAAYHRKSGKDKDEIADLMSAETWMTASEAKEMGFADVVEAPVAIAASAEKFELLGKFKNVPQQFKGGAQAPVINAGTSGKKEESHMADPKKPELTRELLASDAPALLNALIAEGKVEGAAAERARIKAVREQTIPGHEALVEALAFDGVTTGEMAAVKVLAAERAARTTGLAALAADAPKPVAQPQAPTTVAAVDPNLPLEERCEAMWQKSPELRNEFTDLDAYKAFVRANENGQIKLLNK